MTATVPTTPTQGNLPPVTDAHRRAAFEAMGWAGWTFELAMQDDIRARIINARAHQIRSREWRATQQHSSQPARRCRIDAAGQPTEWATQIVPGPLKPITQKNLF